ncbi:hypothetical protein [Gordonia sp. (in: high G+C Gram-positive bacteria)]|uniref:hypothetical protein n=1 Tax=unclassified Gordonia (in: high G+C Gram-positive bacteria) TaxID=2657482 RepID=UPI002614B39F|nr:hypothetical protein [Gordonia sp. (in: high G+C Gram-positive bacteria)]
MTARPDPAAPEAPDLPTLIGLRSPLVTVAAAVLVAGYVIAMIGASASASGGLWAAQVFSLVLQVLCLVGVIAIPADPLPVWAAAVIGVASLCALALAWWHLPHGSQFWVQVTMPPALAAVVAGIVAIRGRFLVAWLMIGGTLLTAAVWTRSHGYPAGMVVPMSNRVIGTVLPAVIVAAMIRPIMELMGALRERELAAVRAGAARRAAIDERDERLAQVAREAGPILARIADGDSFTEEEALAVRLLEFTLRDEVRGRGWYSEGTRVAAAAARSRGVTVALFDDGGLDLDALTAADAERLRGELIRVLHAASSGAVTARILPPGRDEVALINVVDGEVVGRRSCVRAAAGLRWA